MAKHGHPDVSEVRAVYAIQLSDVRRVLKIRHVRGTDNEVLRQLAKLILKPEHFIDIRDVDDKNRLTHKSPTPEVWVELMQKPAKVRVGRAHLLVECVTDGDFDKWNERTDAAGSRIVRELALLPEVLPKGMLVLRHDNFRVQVLVRLGFPHEVAIVTDSGGRELVPERSVRVTDERSGEQKTTMLFFLEPQCFVITMTKQGNAVIYKYAVVKRPTTGEYLMTREVVAMLRLTVLYLEGATSDDEETREEGMAELGKEFHNQVASRLYDQFLRTLIEAYRRLFDRDARVLQTKGEWKRDREQVRREAGRRARDARRDADKAGEPINVPQAGVTEAKGDGASQPPSAEEVDAEAAAEAALAGEPKSDADAGEDPKGAAVA